MQTLELEMVIDALSCVNSLQDPPSYHKIAVDLYQYLSYTYKMGN